jgi:hypothetical protein
MFAEKRGNEERRRMGRWGGKLGRVVWSLLRWRD